MNPYAYSAQCLGEYRLPQGNADHDTWGLRHGIPHPLVQHCDNIVRSAKVKTMNSLLMSDEADQDGAQLERMFGLLEEMTTIGELVQHRHLRCLAQDARLPRAHNGAEIAADSPKDMPGDGVPRR